MIYGFEFGNWPKRLPKRCIVAAEMFAFPYWVVISVREDREWPYYVLTSKSLTEDQAIKVAFQKRRSRPVIKLWWPGKEAMFRTLAK